MTDARTVPTHGGRVVLALASTSPEAVVYAASLHTESASFTGEVRIVLATGEVVFAPWQPAEPPGWLLTFARAFLRSAWLARREADGEPWPHRINRWRAEKA